MGMDWMMLEMGLIVCSIRKMGRKLMGLGL